MKYERRGNWIILRCDGCNKTRSITKGYPPFEVGDLCDSCVVFLKSKGVPNRPLTNRDKCPKPFKPPETPLVKGGQGRSDEEVSMAAWLLLALVGCLLALALGYALAAVIRQLLP